MARESCIAYDVHCARWTRNGGTTVPRGVAAIYTFQTEPPPIVNSNDNGTYTKAGPIAQHADLIRTPLSEEFTEEFTCTQTTISLVAPKGPSEAEVPDCLQCC